MKRCFSLSMVGSIVCFSFMASNSYAETETYKTPAAPKNGGMEDYVSATLNRDCVKVGKEPLFDTLCKRQTLTIHVRYGDGTKKNFSWNSDGIPRTADGSYAYNVQEMQRLEVPDGSGDSALFYYISMHKAKDDNPGMQPNVYGIILDSNLKTVIPVNAQANVAKWFEKSRKAAKSAGEKMEEISLIDISSSVIASEAKAVTAPTKRNDGGSVLYQHSGSKGAAEIFSKTAMLSVSGKIKRDRDPGGWKYDLIQSSSKKPIRINYEGDDKLSKFLSQAENKGVAVSIAGVVGTFEGGEQAFETSKPMTISTVK